MCSRWRWAVISQSSDNETQGDDGAAPCLSDREEAARPIVFLPRNQSNNSESSQMYGREEVHHGRIPQGDATDEASGGTYAAVKDGLFTGASSKMLISWESYIFLSKN